MDIVFLSLAALPDAERPRPVVVMPRASHVLPYKGAALQRRCAGRIRMKVRWMQRSNAKSKTPLEAGPRLIVIWYNSDSGGIGGDRGPSNSPVNH